MRIHERACQETLQSKVTYRSTLEESLVFWSEIFDITVIVDGNELLPQEATELGEPLLHVTVSTTCLKGISIPKG